MLFPKIWSFACSQQCLDVKWYDGFTLNSMRCFNQLKALQRSERPEPFPNIVFRTFTPFPTHPQSPTSTVRLSTLYNIWYDHPSFLCLSKGCPKQSQRIEGRSNLISNVLSIESDTQTEMWSSIGLKEEAGTSSCFCIIRFVHWDCTNTDFAKDKIPY